MTTTCDVTVTEAGLRFAGCGERRILNGDEYVCIGEFVGAPMPGEPAAHIHYMRTAEDEQRLAPLA